MKKNLLSIILLSLAITSFGQITITNDDIAPVGTTIYMANDSIPAAEIVPGDAGANKTWDFTNVEAHEIDTFNLVNPSSTPYADEFPASNFAMTFENDSIFMYMERNDDKLSQKGLAFNLGEEEDPVFMHTVPENIILDFPVNYENTYDETYTVDYVISSPEPGADSVRIKTNTNKSTKIDAWGNLMIPMGNFDVLRQRVEEISTDSIFVYLLGSWMFISATTDTTVNYSWWTDDVAVGFSLFSIDVSPSTGDVDGSISFMNSFPVGLTENVLIESRVFPNPVSNVLNIEFEEAQNGEVVIMNQTGQIVADMEIHGQKHVQVNFSRLPSGLYLYSLRNKSGEVVANGKIMKQ